MMIEYVSGDMSVALSFAVSDRFFLFWAWIPTLTAAIIGKSAALPKLKYAGNATDKP
jgi:hypothetical protein